MIESPHQLSLWPDELDSIEVEAEHLPDLLKLAERQMRVMGLRRHQARGV